jgi:hypothetical protein
MSAAVALFAFGAITAMLSSSLPLGTLRLPGSGAFPLVLGLILMGLAAAQGWSQLKAPASKPTAAARPFGANRRVVLFMAIVAATTALLPAIGYLASSFLLMLGLLRVLGVPWAKAAAIGLICALAARVIFVGWLHIPLPTGIVGF